MHLPRTLPARNRHQLQPNDFGTLTSQKSPNLGDFIIAMKNRLDSKLLKEQFRKYNSERSNALDKWVETIFHCWTPTPLSTEGKGHTCLWDWHCGTVSKAPFCNTASQEDSLLESQRPLFQPSPRLMRLGKAGIRQPDAGAPHPCWETQMALAFGQH